jgi:hypothetical protein
MKKITVVKSTTAHTPTPNETDWVGIRSLEEALEREYQRIINADIESFAIGVQSSPDKSDGIAEWEEEAEEAHHQTKMESSLREELQRADAEAVDEKPRKPQRKQRVLKKSPKLTEKKSVTTTTRTTRWKSYGEGIIAAITDMGNPTGSTAIKIKKKMQGSLSRDKKWMNAVFSSALKRVVASGDVWYE